MVVRSAPSDERVSNSPCGSDGQLQEDKCKEQTDAERRRLLYERIARGNALAEVEEAARRKWSGK